MATSMTISVEGVQVAEIDAIPYQSGMNVQQAMEQAYNLHQDPAYNFLLNYFGDELGYFVSTLDGVITQVGSDPNTYLFWELFVNGIPPNTGIDSTFLSDGDTVGWNYTHYVAERHAGTAHERIRSLLTAARGR
jgi:hypothetical protein